MRAITQRRYGTGEVLRLERVGRPAPGPGEVLVRVGAASLNALDWHVTTGTPYLMRLSDGLRRPKRRIPGVDLAGTVEAVGDGVTRFQPGDQVFGSGAGSCAEFTVAVEEGLAPLPRGLTFEQAAAVPVAAITALQGVSEHGQVRSGDQVLVNGAAGGVGTFAVQIAKALGAEVTAVCSTHNVDAVRSLGADHVVDYGIDDFVERGGRYDVILDGVGNRSPSELRRVLTDDGVCVVISGPKRNRLLGPVTHIVRMLLAFKFYSPRAVTFVAEETSERLLAVTELIESGAVTPVIERTYPLDQTAEALDYLGSGHARAKLVITP